MKPIGPLMWEHRLIEKMVQLIQSEADRIRGQSGPDILLIDQAVDFFKTYADRTHHGKEEDILFRDLAAKPPSGELRRTMEELVQEHVQARTMVGRLVDAKQAYVTGTKGGLESVADCLKELAAFYPQHIIKEDKHFFFPCLDYFSSEEQDRMLHEFYEFDRQMIHEKYSRLVEGFLGQKVLRPGFGKIK